MNKKPISPNGKLDLALLQWAASQPQLLALSHQAKLTKHHWEGPQGLLSTVFYILKLKIFII